MNKTLKQLLAEAKNVGLTSVEKKTGQENLRLFIKNHPLPPVSFWLNFRTLILQPAPIFLVIVLLVAGGTTLAAERALPGEILYPLKVGVNEPMRGWLALSEQTRADWDTKLVSRRLEEAEGLASEAKLSTELNAQIETNFQAQVDRVQARIAKFNDRDAKVAADVASKLEVSLRVHDRILSNISSASKEMDKPQLDSLLAKVRVGTKAVTKDRTREENEVKVQSKPTVQVAAEGRMRAAQNALAEVDRFITEKSEQLGVTATAQARVRLALANQLMLQGQAKFKDGAYADAFALLGQARSVAQEAKLLIEAKGRLEIEGLTTSPSFSSTPVVRDEESRGESGGEQSPGGSRRSRIKIDLGL